MKKLFTLILLFPFFSNSFAQDGRWNHRADDNRDYYRHQYDNPDYREGRFFEYRNNRYWWNQKNEVIEQIASYANYQIQMVIQDWSMDRWDKNRAIREIREQEQRDINSINAQCAQPQFYPNPYRRHHDDDDEEGD